jgi:hypothetical protein
MKDERTWRLEELREEARYRRERLQLYQARRYAGRAGNEDRLREYKRASQDAAARLQRAQAQIPPKERGDSGDSATRPPDPPSARTSS